MDIDQIKTLIASVQTHLDCAERDLKALYDANAHTVMGCASWDVFMADYFGRDYQWLYRQLHTLHVREALIETLGETSPIGKTTIESLNATTCREFHTAEAHLWADIALTAFHTGGGKITAAAVKQAAVAVTSYLKDGSVQGVPLPEILAAGMVEDMRQRNAALGNREYIVANELAAVITRTVWNGHVTLSFTMSETAVQKLDEADEFRISIWREVPNGA